MRTSGLLCDPHSFLTVTFWLLDTLIQYGRIVSVLPLRLREPSRDIIHLWFKNAFTYGRCCHSNRFFILRNHTRKVVPRAYHSCWNPFYIRHLFGSFSFSFIFFMRYCTKALETNVIYNSAEYIYIYIYIYIIIMSRHQHGSLWSSPATLLCRPSLPVGLQGYIQYRHRAVCMYVLTGRPAFACPSMWRGPQEYITYEFVPTSPAVSGSSKLDSFRAAALRGAASRTCSILLAAFFNSVLGVWILRFNGQDQIVRSGNYCCSSIRVASIDKTAI